MNPDTLSPEYHAADRRRRHEAIREARAGRIARAALDKHAYLPGDRLSFARAMEVATAAALQALTETEDAR